MANHDRDKDVEPNFRRSSIWRKIIPKIGMARNILFSTIDLLEKQNIDQMRKDFSLRRRFKNTIESVWTLSTIDTVTGTSSNIYVNPSVLKDILALDKELASVLNDLHLNQNQSSRIFSQQLHSSSHFKFSSLCAKKSKTNRFLPSDSISPSLIGKNLQESSITKSDSRLSQSPYSTDSIVSQKRKRKPSFNAKKNLIIRCNYSPDNQPKKNVIQVYRHDPICCTTIPLCQGSCAGEFDGSDTRIRKRRVHRLKSEDSFISRRKEEKRENERLRKEEKRREKERKLKEKEKKEREKKEKKERRRQKRSEEELRIKKKSKKHRRDRSRSTSDRSDSEESFERKWRDSRRRRRESSTSEESSTSRSRRETQATQTAKQAPTSRTPTASTHAAIREQTQTRRMPPMGVPTAVQIPVPPPACLAPSTGSHDISCEIPVRCWLPSESAQETDPIQRKVCRPDCDAQTITCQEPPRRSRIAKFLSNFGNGGLRLRFISPHNKNKCSRNCMIPKIHIPQTLTVDTSRDQPKVRFSNENESVDNEFSKLRPEARCTKTHYTPNRQLNTQRDPIYHESTCRTPPTSCRPPPAKSSPCVSQPCVQPDKCYKRAPSSIRLKPRLTPSSKFRPTCRVRSSPCQQKPCESERSAPMSSGPRAHVPPPTCNRRFGEPFFPPKSVTCRSRDGDIFESVHGHVDSSHSCRSCPQTPRNSDRKPFCTPQNTHPYQSSPQHFPSSYPSRTYTPCTPSHCPQTPRTPPPYPPCSHLSPPRTPPPRTPPICSPNICTSRPPPQQIPSAPISSLEAPVCFRGASRPCTPNRVTCDPNPCPSKPCTPTFIPQTSGSRPRTPPCHPPHETACKSCLSKHSSHPYNSQCELKKWQTDRLSRQRSHTSICDPAPCREPILSATEGSNRGRPFDSKRYGLESRHHPPRRLNPDGCYRKIPHRYERQRGWNDSHRRRHICSPSSDSDICCSKSSYRSRRLSPSPVYSREDVCYLKRKNRKPWWVPREHKHKLFPRLHSRPPSSCSLEEYSDDGHDHRSPRRCIYRPKRCYYSVDSPYGSMEKMCLRVPKECVSIPCTSAPYSSRLYSSPRDTMSFMPQSTHLLRPHPLSFLPTTQPCVPPSRPYFPPSYPPQYTGPFPPTYVPRNPPFYPPFQPISPVLSRTCVGESGPRWRRPTPCNSNTRPIVVPAEPKKNCVKRPPWLKKIPKACGGKPCTKKHFPEELPCPSPPICSSQQFSHSRSGPFISPSPSTSNIGYKCYPSPSGSNYGFTNWPNSSCYPPYGYWQNPYQGYGAYPSVYPSQTFSGPGTKSQRPTTNKSIMKSTRTGRTSCKSGQERSNYRKSSSSSTISSSSSQSSMSSSYSSSYSSATSSSCSSTSGMHSPDYYVPSYTNFPPKKSYNSSISSSTFSSSMSRKCGGRERCIPKCKPGRSPCLFSPPFRRRNFETKQPRSMVEPSVSSASPVKSIRSQVCSSATELRSESKLRYKGIDHYDDRIRFELKKIGINQLIQASKPAKCCKQTVLNQPSKEELPYAASLASLPLDRADIRVIRQSVRMASKKADYDLTSVHNRNKLVYYTNLVFDNSGTKSSKTFLEYEVCYFYFTLEDPENIQLTLEKAYNRRSSFRFFQLIDWKVEIFNQSNNVDALEQKIDITENTDLINVSLQKNDTPCVTSSIGKSMDSLENIIFSNFFYPEPAGVGDSQIEYVISGQKMNENQSKKTKKRNEKLSMNFNTRDFENIKLALSSRSCSCRSKKTDAFSQTYITINPGETNLDHFEYGREIHNLHPYSNGDSMKRINDLIDSTFRGDSLDFFHDSKLFKDKNFTSHLNEFCEDKFSCEVTEQLISSESGFKSETSQECVLGEGCFFDTLNRDATKNLRYNKENDFLMKFQQESSVYNVCLLRRKLSKGHCFVKMYNSIHEVFNEICKESKNFVTLKKEKGVKEFSVLFSRKYPIKTIKYPRNSNMSSQLKDESIKKKKILGQPVSNIYTSTGKIVMKFYNSKGREVTSINNEKGDKIIESNFSKELASVLYDSAGNFIPKYFDSFGNLLNAVYDSQNQLLEKIFDSETFLANFSSSEMKKKSELIYNAQGYPVYQIYSDRGELLTSIYDFEGCLVRGTFTGSVTQLIPRLFDRNGKFIQGRYNKKGVMIKRIHDCYGHSLQQLYRSDGTVFQERPMRLRISNQQGESLRIFSRRNGTILTQVYDVLGNLLCQASDGNCTDLFSRLFDLNGFFISGRLDEFGRSIRGVFDDDGEKINEIRTELTNRKIREFYTFDGKILRNFFNKQGTRLRIVYGFERELVGVSEEGKASELAGGMFDMAGYFIHGRYDSEKNLIKGIYDDRGYQIFQIYDANGKIIRNIQHSNGIFDIENKQIRHIYKSNEEIIKSVYDVNGDMMGGVLSIEAEDLAPFLYDMEGKFINNRFDSKMNLIKHVYDSEEEFLDRIFTHANLTIRLSNSSPKVEAPVETTNIEEQEIVKFHNAGVTAVEKTTALVELPFGKRKSGGDDFGEAREFVSIKCQCRPRKKRHAMKMETRKDNVSNHKRKTFHQIDTTEIINNMKNPQIGTINTILPLHETRVPSRRSEDSLESFIDDYLYRGKKKDTRHSKRKKSINHEMIEDTLLDCLNLTRNSKSMKRISHTVLQYFAHVVFNRIKSNYYKLLPKMRKGQDSTVLFFRGKRAYAYLQYDSPEKNQGGTEYQSNFEVNDTPYGRGQDKESYSISNVDSISKNMDAFLCNIPNAPPFILRMNKAPSETEVSENYANDEFERNDLNSTDESMNTEDDTSSTSLDARGLNMLIDGNCPGLEDAEFRKFVAKSISFIRTEEEERWLRMTGGFASQPTVCMTGLTGLSSNPFDPDDIDTRGPFLKSDASSSHFQSKIPRILHPGRCKVRSKMKNVQLSSGSKGYSANHSKNTTCPAGKTEIQINPCVKVSVSTTCPSFANPSTPKTLKAGNTNQNPNGQVSKPAIGDCKKNLKTDPGCYCGNDTVVDPTPCPILQREDYEDEEIDAEFEEPEENEASFFPTSDEQPVLMKQSDVECDCANRRRCEQETLVEPPKEKPDVFWALTKVSLLKDGTKNFEIIDVSPVPPGYYLLPDTNNLVLVGPQPKPSKATPSKNCCCK